MHHCSSSSRVPNLLKHPNLKGLPSTRSLRARRYCCNNIHSSEENKFSSTIAKCQNDVAVAALLLPPSFSELFLSLNSAEKLMDGNTSRRKDHTIFSKSLAEEKKCCHNCAEYSCCCCCCMDERISVRKMVDLSEHGSRILHQRVFENGSCFHTATRAGEEEDEIMPLADSLFFRCIGMAPRVCVSLTLFSLFFISSTHNPVLLLLRLWQQRRRRRALFPRDRVELPLLLPRLPRRQRGGGRGRGHGSRPPPPPPPESAGATTTRPDQGRRRIEKTGTCTHKQI